MEKKICLLFLFFSTSNFPSKKSLNIFFNITKMLYILLTRYWLVATHRAWELKEKKALFLREINLLKIKLNSFKGNIFFSLPKRHNSSETKFEMIESFLSLKNDLDCFSWDAGKNLYNQILLKMKFLPESCSY